MMRDTVDKLRLHATALLFPVIFASLASSLPCAAYQEAPMLAERVAQGELPPVEQRLPENPAVVAPVESISTYGGTWRRAAYYREAGLDFIVKMDARGLSTLQAHNGNYNFFGYRNGVMHWVVHPLWHVPRTGGSNQ